MFGQFKISYLFSKAKMTKENPDKDRFVEAITGTLGIICLVQKEYFPKN